MLVAGYSTSTRGNPLWTALYLPIVQTTVLKGGSLEMTGLVLEKQYATSTFGDCSKDLESRDPIHPLGKSYIPNFHTYKDDRVIPHARRTSM